MLWLHIAKACSDCPAILRTDLPLRSNLLSDKDILEGVKAVSNNNDANCTNGDEGTQQPGFNGFAQHDERGKTQGCDRHHEAEDRAQQSASATGIVPKMSAYMGIPRIVASITPKGLRLPSTFSTQLSGIQL